MKRLTNSYFANLTELYILTPHFMDRKKMHGFTKPHFKDQKKTTDLVTHISVKGKKIHVLTNPHFTNTKKVYGIIDLHFNKLP